MTKEYLAKEVVFFAIAEKKIFILFTTSGKFLAFQKNLLFEFRFWTSQIFGANYGKNQYVAASLGQIEWAQVVVFFSISLHSGFDLLIEQ